MATRDALLPAERGAPLNETRLVTAAEELLAWIVDGRPITDTGLPRRTDIALVGRRLLDDLAAANVVTFESDGSLHVVAALRGIIAHDLVLAQAVERSVV